MRVALTLIFLAGCGSAPPVSTAPDFELPALDGPAVKGSALWGSKPVVLVFMTSW